VVQAFVVQAFVVQASRLLSARQAGRLHHKPDTTNRIVNQKGLS
jgi:hypothetical protein